ncbi:uncharacterized protein PRCAT00000227001 [Priceomyces carsonii]|uniref:uncharacterized protein n=1 Tax=Priceomyces carsonii TaxID=28549 RepID=UPI002EDA71CB|nr:unnamed protein product [Priceomyces carsonii]
MKAKSKASGKKGSKAIARPKKTEKRSKPLSLKQKLHKESKVVKVGNLNWKQVEIPDNLDDYEGFYGLEELEGVDVKVVDGQPQFLIADNNSKQSDEESSHIEEEVKEEKVKEEEEAEEEEEEEEFKGFDDTLSTREYEDEKNDVRKNSKSGKFNDKDSKHKEKDDLENVGFQSLSFPLPDDISLPHWENIGSDQNVVLSSYTLNALSSAGFKKPTPIQKKTIPLALAGKDVIGKAITGSGKTLAYGIPILEKYLSNVESFEESKSIRPPAGIVFAPTRELAQQVVDHLNGIAKYSPLSVNGIVGITGGLSIQKQERLLSKGPGILVATPGRCLEILEKDPILLKRLAMTDIVVLDEADRLLQDGHFEEFERILELLQKNRPKDNSIPWKWQTLVFSATFSRDLFGKLDKKPKDNKSQGSSLIENDHILQLLNEKLHFKDSKPALADANPQHLVNNKITEALVECGPSERDLYLYYFLLMFPGSTLVFANAIDSVKRLVPFLNSLNIPTFSIHSSMIQKQRLRSLERFKEASQKNKVAVLVASDVAARGLDIPAIDHVAHYHLPRSADIYIHRSGRTGRAGKEGVSIMFCSPQEVSGSLKRLRKLVSGAKNSLIGNNGDLKLLPIEMDILSQLKQRVSIATKLADSTISTSSTRSEKSWVTEAAEELGIDEDADVDMFQDPKLDKSRRKRENKLLSKEESKFLRLELKDLLSQPVRRNMRKSYLTSGLQNLAHQMITGSTNKNIIGQEEVRALDKLKVGKKNQKTFEGSQRKRSKN